MPNVKGCFYSYACALDRDARSFEHEFFPLCCLSVSQVERARGVANDVSICALSVDLYQSLPIDADSLRIANSDHQPAPARSRSPTRPPPNTSTTRNVGNAGEFPHRLLFYAPLETQRSPSAAEATISSRRPFGGERREDRCERERKTAHTHTHTHTHIWPRIRQARTGFFLFFFFFTRISTVTFNQARQFA